MTSLRLELNSDSTAAIDGRQIRAVSFQDVRIEYLQRTLDLRGISAGGSRALVVGSGRGLLAHGFAELGLQVTAVDPSAAATEIATRVSAGSRLDVTHRIAPAEDLGLVGQEFDVAFYADTFEITTDLDRVIAQAASALRPGGVLVYDTVNRTLASRLIYLGAFQALPMTRIMPRGRYSASRLRTPSEISATFARHGLHNIDICAFKPKNPRGMVKAVLARRSGRIGDDDIPALVDFVLAPRGRPVVTYLGHAVKETGPTA